VCIPHALIGKIKTLHPGKEILSKLERLSPLNKSKSWMVSGGAGSLDWFGKIISSVVLNEEHPMIFCSAEVESFDGFDTHCPMTERWLEVLGTPIVPFDLQKRKHLEERAEETIGAVLHARRAAAKSNKSRRKKSEDSDEAEDED
jgi:hypothetical protein